MALLYILFILLLPFLAIGPPLVVLYFVKEMIDKSLDEEENGERK